MIRIERLFCGDFRNDALKVVGVLSDSCGDQAAKSIEAPLTGSQAVRTCTAKRRMRCRTFWLGPGSESPWQSFALTPLVVPKPAVYFIPRDAQTRKCRPRDTLGGVPARIHVFAIVLGALLLARAAADAFAVLLVGA